MVSIRDTETEIEKVQLVTLYNLLKIQEEEEKERRICLVRIKLHRKEEREKKPNVQGELCRKRKMHG